MSSARSQRPARIDADAWQRRRARLALKWAAATIVVTSGRSHPLAASHAAEDAR
ncbi:MAG: hypothetical protein KDI45_08715 [Candidatus Accumulibacter sp.]|nr:hypothetical protein [Accumulibacter sp.]